MMTKEERLIHKAKYGTWYMPNGGEEMSSQMKDFVDGLPEDSYEKKAERHQKEGLLGKKFMNKTNFSEFMKEPFIKKLDKAFESEKIHGGRDGLNAYRDAYIKSNQDLVKAMLLKDGSKGREILDELSRMYEELNRSDNGFDSTDGCGSGSAGEVVKPEVIILQGPPNLSPVNWKEEVCGEDGGTCTVAIPKEMAIGMKVCINGIEVGNFTDAERFLVRGAIASCRKWAEKEKIDVSNLLKKLDAVMEPIDPK